MKLARKHIIDTIELALAVSGPISKDYPKYTIYATPYRILRQKGNSGVKVTWVPAIQKTK